MNLGVLIDQTAKRIRKNWILILPPVLIQVVMPLVFLIPASFVLFPLTIAYGLIGDTWGLIQTTVASVLLLALGIFLVDTFVTAGWAYMNKRVVLEGRTEFADLWTGAKRYFMRILGGRIIVAMAFIVPLAMGIAAVATSILALDARQLTPPEQLTPTALVNLLAPIIFGLFGIVLVVGFVELVLYIFFLPWMQALVMDDLGVTKSIRSSLMFVRRNFATMIGFIAISGIAWIIASLLASLVWPGFSYSELTRPAIYMNSAHVLELLLRADNLVYSLISALLSAFFTLLLFVIYADRTRGSQAPVSVEQPIASSVSRDSEHLSPRREARRGIKYCMNCGTQLITLAVFCPNCGARQPPLVPQ